MITLSVAAKAGAVCLSLLSPEVLICRLPKMHLDAVICMTDGCRTPRQLYREWRHHPERQSEFYLKLYGAR
jgi:hypothetical protein